MGLRSNYVYKGITRTNAYCNIHIVNVRKMSGQWRMDITIRVFTDKDDILIVSIFKENFPHIPGNCIHDEAYAHAKSMPELYDATNDQEGIDP